MICFIPRTEIAPNAAHGDAALKKINDRHGGTMFSSKEYPYYDREDFSSLKIYTVKDHTQLIHPENGLGSKQHPKLTKIVGERSFYDLRPYTAKDQLADAYILKNDEIGYCPKEVDNNSIID